MSSSKIAAFRRLHESGCFNAVVALAIICLTSWPEDAAAQSSRSEGETLFASYWEWRLSESPELATRAGRSDFNDRWQDWSADARGVAQKRRREFLEALQQIPVDSMTATERVSARMLEYEIKRDLESEDYRLATERMNQRAPLAGMHGMVFGTIDQMPARTVHDYESIIARIRALPLLVDQHIALWRTQIGAGLTQPVAVVDIVLEQITAQRGASASNSPLLAAFRRFPDDIPAGDRERLLAAGVDAYNDAFAPSWTRLEAFVREVYRPGARPEISVATLPGGSRSYDVLVRYWTETHQSAAEIHATGLREVERIEQEMEALARSTGFGGTLQEFERNLADRPDMRFESREQMLEYARITMNRVKPELAKMFLRVPPTPIDVRPIAADVEASAATSYTPGTPDGARSAWLNLRTYMPETQVKYPLDAIVLHESMPGHHLQVGLSQEVEGLPDFRRYFRSAAFSEGWGLYAETLGVEMGVYRDPVARFGQLASEEFRAVRLVVDTGIHAMGWSRERARQYLAQHAPSQSLAEVDRYIADPGQALAYKIGQLKISELRARAQRDLGPKFAVREFHDAVLRNGTLPLEVLEEQVMAYIKERLASSSD